jgi:HSP20 family protein
MATASKATRGARGEASVPVRPSETRLATPRWDPWELRPFQLMSRMDEEMSRLRERLFGREIEPASWTALRPRIDVYERNGEVDVKAELPGVKPEDISINATEDAVILTGDTRREEEVEEEGYYRHERSFGHFHRTIDLPTPVKADQAKATFKEGVLEIVLPKAEGAPRAVKVPIEK